jgi:hypothetical protein
MAGLLGVAAFLLVLALSAWTGLARAVWMTDASGQVQDKNIYESRCGVYLNGNKWPASITVYVRVTATNGDSLNYQGPSTVVTNADGNFGPFGPLCPYDLSKNGEYKAWASLSPDFRQGDETKTDYFKVQGNAVPAAADDLAKTEEDVPVDIAVLVNDLDLDGDALIVTSLTAPGHGTAVSDGIRVRYVPDPDWSGSDSFRYTVSDSLGGAAEAQVTVMVAPADDPVMAVEDGYVVAEDTLLSVSAPGVQGNDAAPDGGATVSVVSPVSHGALTLNGNGAFGYMPAANWNGTDDFEYRLTDGDGDSATARVTITVTPEDDPVAAADDTYAVAEDEILDVRTPGVLGNDSAPDGGASVTLVSGVAYGTLSLTESGAFSYVPTANWSGTDDFEYRLTDEDGCDGTATVTITVTPEDDPVTAVDDSYRMAEDDVQSVQAPGVAENDTAPDGRALISLVLGVAHGALTLNGDGSFDYVPERDWNGIDRFEYRLEDGDRDDGTATVTITVTPEDDRVTAEDDAHRVAEDDVLEAAAPGVMGNDTAPDGGAFVRLTQGVSHGAVALADDGAFSYRPDADWSGTDRFTYVLRDADGDEATATVTITVLPKDDPAATVDDEYRMIEDSVLDVGAPGVRENDVAPDGGISLSVMEGPARGTLDLRSDGSFSYGPNAAWNGTDRFTYRLTDEDGDSATAAVTITVTPEDDPVVAVEDDYAIAEDAALSILAPGVLENDSAPDGGVSVELADNPTHGLLNLLPDGSFSYAPEANWSGADGFVYRLSDRDGDEGTGTVKITVDPADDAVTAADDSYGTSENTVLLVASPGVLGNDATPDGGATLTLVGDAHGALALDADGSFRYEPQADWSGIDRFTYRLSDGDGDTDTATVTIEVGGVDDPVDAVKDSFSTSEDTPLVVSLPGVMANDAAPDGGASVSLAVGVAHGTLVLNGDGSFRYTPDPDWNGTDAFSYRLADGDGDKAAAPVEITVTAVEDPLITTDDAYRTPEDATLSILAPGVLGNDIAPDGGMSTALASGPAHGSVSLSAEGGFTYIPERGWSGADRFTYRLADGDGDSTTAAVTVTVVPGNEPPVAVDDVATAAGGSEVEIDVLANDRDPEGDTLVLLSFTDPDHGSLSRVGGSLRYRPAPGFAGMDAFAYVASDAHGGTDEASVVVTVAAENLPPVARDDLALTLEGKAVEIHVLANDRDPEGDLSPRSLVIVQLPADGSVDFVAGVVTYTPDAGFHGTDHLSYMVDDARGARSNLATVTIGVASAALPPLAWGDVAVTETAAAVTIDVLANDTDEDGTLVPGTVELASAPQHGAVTIGPDGRVTYLPSPGFVGTDIFLYIVEDDDGNVSNEASVTVAVARVVGGGAAGASACEGRVILSEIGWAGSAADRRDEWIELRNLGTTPVDLSGWVLRWRSTRSGSSADQAWKTVALSGVILPGRESACGGPAHDRASSFEVVRRDEVSWSVVGDGVGGREGYYLLEHRRDETVRDLPASLLYDEGGRSGLDLSDEGEALELLNDRGEVVDTANAFHPGVPGWAAGSAATFASMERTEPLGPDVAENWHTNMGVVTTGLDAEGRPLLATTGAVNSAALETLVLAAGVERVQVVAGTRLDLGLDLSRSDRKTSGWPWILVTRPDLRFAGGSGMVEISGASFAGRQADDWYWLTIDTAGFPAGEAYDVWIVYGQGKLVFVPIEVTLP